MNHRGPDASGYWTNEEAKLGHTRLKIVDLDDRSNQPFWSADRRYLIVFNGEIYNYRQLAIEHRISRHTTCDTEIILELYARLGPDCVAQLNGMFAFVIFDTHTSEYFAARDRLGVKPLYVCTRNGRLTLASEMAPMLELTGIGPLDEVGLRQYRKLRTFFNGSTIYAGVQMFPAGHYMVNGKLVQYWRLPEGEQSPPSDEEVRALIAESVQMRRIADVPLGSYLSGGLDSTIIAALVGKTHTWTVGFADENEFSWSRLASKALGTTHHEVLVSPDEFVELARAMIRKRREPLSVPNEVLLYKMTSEARRYNTVILSGEGADELFFGYDRIFRWAARAKTFDLIEFDRLYSYSQTNDLEIVESVVAPFLHWKTPALIVAAFFQCAHLHGLLRRLDNSTMLCSVEARVPFVDHHPLVERLAGVSATYRMKDGVVKAPLKRAFRNILPAEIIDRPKVGFPVPLANIPFPSDDTQTPMDRWLEFNLNVLTS